MGTYRLTDEQMLVLTSNKLSTIVSITANATLTIQQFGKNGDMDVYVDCTAAAITVTLPAAADVVGYTVNIIKTDASPNAVSIKGAGTTNINQANVYPLTTRNQTAAVKSNTNQYWIF